jgi:hypothetical protein
MKLCPHCGAVDHPFVTSRGVRVCTRCGERSDLPPTVLAYKNDKKLRDFVREAVAQAMPGAHSRIDALEKRIDGLVDREINRMTGEIRAERYDAWMGGVLSQMPSDALVRELGRRLK